jgi:Zn ribbon nucleic-acid-binding protein
MDVPACKHERTKLVARDENEEYFECLDCGEIFERAEREPVAGFDDSLSDA